MSDENTPQNNAEAEGEAIKKEQNAAPKEEATPIEKQIPSEDIVVEETNDVAATETDSDKAPDGNADEPTQTTEVVSEDIVEEKPEAEEVKSEKEEEEEEEEIASSDDTENENEVEEAEDVDYSGMSKQALIAAFALLLKNKPVQEIKKEAEDIKAEFNAKFSEALEEKKAEFLAEGGNIIDFHYSTPLKKEFNSLFFDYREKRNNYYKNLKKDLQANLVKREELIEELKGLLTAEENINTTYKQFKDIQETWHTAGAIPRDKYNLTWNTYHHHVENFYDFLHLNREFRDLDFKHNLEAKLKLIVRAEELQQETDVNKAFRELQMLHKM